MMSLRWKMTASGIGAAALSITAAIFPGSASADSTPPCQQPSPYKCLAIDNQMHYQDDDHPAMNSIVVRQTITEGNSRSNPVVTGCYNISPGQRLYLSSREEFFQGQSGLSPNDTIYIQQWSEPNCDGGNAVSDLTSDNIVIANDNLSYTWITLKR